MIYRKTLVISVGVREIQIPKDKYQNFIRHFSFYESNVEKIFYENPEDSDYYIIKQDSVYYIGEKLYNLFDQFEEYFTYPIIEPVLQKEKSVDEIVLIATDQEDVDERYKLKDTIFLAKILKKLFENKNFKVSILELKKSLSEKYNENLKYLFSSLQPFDNYGGELIFEVSGGAPQIREMIYLLLPFFKSKLKLYQVSSNNIINLFPNVIGPIKLASMKNEIFRLVDSYEYSILKDLLENLDLRTDNKLSFSLDLLRFLHDKMNFAHYNNSKYKELFSDYLETKVYSFDDPIIKSNEKISNYVAKIINLVDIIEIDYKKKNWQAFVAEIFRWFDAISTFIFGYLVYKNNFWNDAKIKEKVKKHLFIGDAESLANRTPNIFEYVCEKLNILDELKGKDVKGNPLRFDMKFYFSYYFLQVLYSQGLFNNIDIVVNNLSVFDKLRTFRNKGIYGHSFSPVSSEKLYESLKDEQIDPESIFDLIDKQTNKLFNIERINLFDKANRNIKLIVESYLEDALGN